MGEARFGWRDIPLAQQADTGAVETGIADLPPAVAVNMGNPHAVFFLKNVEEMDVPAVGRFVETHPMFPEKTNVEFAKVLNRGSIRVRVWERAAGMTLACGSGACAVLVAAVRRNLTERKADIILDGGVLQIEWLANNHVLMSGDATLSFYGEMPDVFP
jgi:diaminopimelate epimerase